MTTRREASAAKQAKLHLDRIEAAETEAQRLRATFSWLIAEARRSGRLTETTAALRRLVDLLRAGKPLKAATAEPAPAVTPAPQTTSAAPDAPWYELTRGGGSTPDRTERGA